MESQDDSTATSTTRKFALPDRKLLSVCKCPPVTPPSSCYDLKDIVTVCVNDQQKRKNYKVLRGLLVWHSAYFAAALDPTNGWQANGEKTIDIDCPHSVFDAFCCWMHTGRLKDPPKHDAPGLKDIYLGCRTLADIWTFADFRGVPELSNSAIDMMHELFAAGWKSMKPIGLRHNIEHIYSNTTTDSALRIWCVDTWKNTISLECTIADSSLFPKEFLCDTLPFLGRRSEEDRFSLPRFTSMDRCQWHDHSGPGGKLRLEGRKGVTASSGSSTS